MAAMRGGREVRVRMEGQLLLNTIDLIRDAAIDGHGLAYLPRDQVQTALEEKKLVRVLDKFTPDLPGYHLYYPHRKNSGSAFSLLIDVLKFSGSSGRTRVLIIRGSHNSAYRTGTELPMPINIDLMK